MKSRFLRFLFTQACFKDGYIHLVTDGEIWSAMPFLELEVLLTRRILGFEIVHLKASGKKAIHFLGSISPLQAGLRAHAANVVQKTTAIVLSLIPNAYPTHSVLDGVWRNCTAQLEKEIREYLNTNIPLKA